MIQEWAPAKVNLALDIVGQRSDGYHEMRMINHSIGLKDRLCLTLSEDLKISCSDPSVPFGKDNLVWKAADALREYCDYHGGAAIYIEKQIPMEAGLAGGSADAAAALRGLNRLWHLGLSLETLQEIGSTVGADVPYCVINGTALVTGFGNGVAPIKALPMVPLLVIKPEINISTPKAFAMADEWPCLCHPNVTAAVTALSEENMKSALAFLGNSFEDPVFHRWPVIRAVKEKLMASGAFYATMSGSGSTVVGYYDDETTVQKAFEQLTADNAIEGHVYLTAVDSGSGEDAAGTA